MSLSGISLFGERKGFVYENFITPATPTLKDDGEVKSKSLTVVVRGIDVACVTEREEINRLYVEHVWPSSIVIADYLCDFPESVYNKVVVELGAGAALPSIVAERLGASVVVVTDYPDATVLQNIDDAIRINKCSHAVGVGYKWGENVDDILEHIYRFADVSVNNNGDNGVNNSADKLYVQVILLADVLWRDTYPQHRSLLESLVKLLKPQGGIVLIGMAHRPCEGHTVENDREFLVLAQTEFGFVVEEVLTTSKYSDAMDSDPIEVFLYKMSRPATS